MTRSRPAPVARILGAISATWDGGAWLGWADVASGLTKILVGYAMWVAGNVVGVPVRHDDQREMLVGRIGHVGHGRFDAARRSLGVAAVPQQHRSAQDRAARIRHALTGDVRCRAVDRFIEAGATTRAK